MNSTVGDLRRAARQPQYELREVLPGSPALDLGPRGLYRSFGDALDAAFDFLDEHDPRRDGDVSGLEIVRVLEELRDTVWSYRHERQGPLNPLAFWGFDVTRPWTGPPPSTAA